MLMILEIRNRPKNMQNKFDYIKWTKVYILLKET